MARMNKAELIAQGGRDHATAEASETETVRPADAAQMRAAMIAANRYRAEYLRRKYGYISSMESIPLTAKLQGPRHAPGLCWPNGEVIARSQFMQVARPNSLTVPNGYVWQWAAFDADGKVLQVCEFSDLWTLREIAAYNIADMYRFVRSRMGQ